MEATHGRLLDKAIFRLEARSSTLWLLAVVLFGFGDLATTFLGLYHGRLVEAGPIATHVVAQFGPLAVVGLKVAAFAVCYQLWRTARKPTCVGVPLGLTVFGTLITAWNVMLLVGLF